MRKVTRVALSLVACTVCSIAAPAQTPKTDSGPLTAQELFAQAISQMDLRANATGPFAYRMGVSVTTAKNATTTGHFVFAWSSPQEWVRMLLLPPLSIAEGTHEGKSWLFISSPAVIPVASQAEQILCPWLVQPRSDDPLKKPSHRKIKGQQVMCVEQTEPHAQGSSHFCFDETTHLLDSVDQDGGYKMTFGDYISWNNHEFPKSTYYALPHGARVEATLEMLDTLAGAKLDADIFEPPAGSRPWEFCDPPDVLVYPKLVFRPRFTGSKRAGAEAEDFTATFQGIVDTDGKLHDVVLFPTGWPDLDKELGAAVLDWKYDPATCNGHPVPTYLSTMTFSVHSKIVAPSVAP
jgi:hypothetical protein